MLAQLTINHFAIVRELEIDFQRGMTAITGETGAGKSIAIDALGLCLGSRAEGAMVRQGAARADVSARFSLNDTPSAQIWLEEHQLDDNNECILRRVISADGRSRGFINGTAVPISQLRELGQHLIQIHGQHAHQLLLKPEHQKQLLDAYAHEPALINDMAQAYHHWHQSCQQLAQQQQLLGEREDRKQLINYQLKELNEFMPQAGEFEQIEQDYKRLANSSQLISVSQTALMVLADNDDNNILSQLHHVKQQLDELLSLDNTLSHLSAMFDEANIQLSEASDELRHYSEQLELDPNALHELEQRISQYMALARKHHIQPETLAEFHQQLLAEYEQLTQADDDQQQLSEAVGLYHQQAVAIAKQLHDTRQRYANELTGLITESMQALSMPHGQFAINVNYTENNLNALGADHIEFIVSTNPGQPLQALSKVASGGELSRIALAIQVITAQKMETPALIFDEVDVGISGPTAAIVGKLLRQLGESTQVMCVTHLPQVAGCGHQHMFVSKETNGLETQTNMVPLTYEARLHELARLLGGSEVTQNTLANAKELLAA